MKRSRKTLYVLIVTVCAVALGFAWPNLVSRVAYAVECGQAQAARAGLQDARDLSDAFYEVTKAVQPSVVNIRSLKKIAASAAQPEIPEAFREFFGDRFSGNHGQREYVQRGLGSGVIVSSDGYILTNNHVVAGASDITVALSDDRTFEADVIGTDEKTDLAVLKINATDLLPAELGDSDALRVGEWVLAMGNPFGLSHTVTAGIISAKGRANMGIADYEDFIQTDAAINPGNSGGPLVSLDGKVIGINTAIATATGRYEGVGFAIPSKMVSQIMDAIINEGGVVRGWLGVGIQPLTDNLAHSFGYDSTEGVLVGHIEPDGPADEAGLKPGDIIVTFNNTPVKDMNKFRNRVAATKPGEQAKVEVFRDGDRQTFTVEIGELPEQNTADVGTNSIENLGLEVQELNEPIAKQLGLEADATGVVVTSVEAGSVAEKRGLLRGDIIVAIGKSTIRNMGDFRRTMRTSDLDKGVRLRVMTRGMQRFVFLKR